MNADAIVFFKQLVYVDTPVFSTQPMRNIHNLYFALFIIYNAESRVDNMLKIDNATN